MLWLLAAPPLPAMGVDGGAPSGNTETAANGDAVDPGIEDGDRRGEAARYRTVVRESRDDDGLDGQRDMDARTAGFASVVELDPEASGRPADALPEVLSRMPGASVRSIGGLGQFASVSVRGSSAQQVQLFIEGVPVTGSAAGLASVGDLPLDALDRVVLHRGLVPVAYGGATIGGAIDLIGARAPLESRAASVSLGLGAFGSREATAAWSEPLRPDRLALTVRAGYAGAAGNFPFYDTGGTPQFEGDDRRARRRNNDYDRLQAQWRLDGAGARLRWHVQQLVNVKRQGVAGSATAQSTATRLRTQGTRLIAGVDRRDGAGLRLGPGGRLGWRFGLGYEQRRFEDPRGEVGLGTDDQRTDSVDVYVSPRLRAAVWKGGWLTAVADHRTEWVVVEQRAPRAGLPTSGDGDRGRFAAGAGIELEQWLFERRWLLAPTVRIDGFFSRFAVASGEGELDDAGQDRADLGFSPRLGTKVRLVEGLDVRASVGRYFRVPTLRELFGDQGWFLGDEGLAPELGTSADAGIILDRPVAAMRGAVYLQLAGFWTRSRNTITWVQTGPVVQPRNLPGATSAGVESGGQLRVWSGLFELAANYTFNATAARSPDDAEDGQPLPGRPRHEAFARPSVGWIFNDAPGRTSFEPRLAYTLDVVSDTYLDPSGRLSLPPRVLHGLALRVSLDEQVHVGVEVRNLTDRIRTSWAPVTGGPRLPYPVVDFVNYPLPGRSVWFSLRITPRFGPPGDLQDAHD